MKLYSLLHKIEISIIYIGCGFGILLALDITHKFFNSQTLNLLLPLCMAVVLWFIGFVVRRVISKKLSTRRDEIVLMLLALTFVVIFKSVFFSSPQVANDLYAYFTHEWVFLILINLAFMILVITFVVISAELIYFLVFKNSQFGLASPARTKSLHAFLFVLLMLLTFTMLVNPVVSHFLNTVEQNINTFLKQNFQSYIDYAMASPIFYYLILNFIGLTKVN